MIERKLGFATVLPAVSDAPAALRRLGIPEHCEAFIGKTWYSEGMQPSPCPEIFRLSRFRMVQLLLKEPNALWRILKKAVLATRPFIVFYGQVEGRDFGRSSDEGTRFSSIGELVGELPSAPYVALCIASVLGGLLSLILLMRVQY